MHRPPFFFLIVFAAFIGKSFSNDLPIRDGLALWLDASAEETILHDDKNKVTAWKSRVGKLTATSGKSAPLLKLNSLGGKPTLRFENGSTLSIKNVLAGKREATVFVVFRREAGKHKPWQKVLSNGTHLSGVLFDLGQNEGEMTTRILRGGFNKNVGPDLWLGTSKAGDWGGLTGDIAEILVYHRSFYVEEPLAKINAYLEKKWGFKEDQSTDWTRGGPLPKTPEHKNQRLPLSDQTNSGQWREHLEMWDEFQGEKLDHTKWWDHNPNWFGRAPARYLAREIQVKEGRLHLSMTKDSSLPHEKFYDRETYRDYSSGSLKSKKGILYGYFEIKAMAMSSAASSAWWFAGTSFARKDNSRWTIEIDVFEIGARSPKHEHAYNMNAHVFRTPTSKRHWNKGGTWKAPFKFDEAFHIYGLEWSPDFIKYYVDGALVRSMKNTHWHTPMQMIFDSETMIDWLGTPKDSDLPSTFEVEYVRAWKNSKTNPKWWETHRMHDPKNSKITRYVRKMAAQ